MDTTPQSPEAEVKQTPAETPEQAAKRAAYNEKARIRNAARRAAKRAAKAQKLAEEPLPPEVTAADELGHPDHPVPNQDEEPLRWHGTDPVLVKRDAKKARKPKAKKAPRALSHAGHDDCAVNTYVRNAGGNVEHVLHGAVPASTLRWLQNEADALVKEIVVPQFDVPAPVIAISIDTLVKKRLAQYHPDRDGMGLRWRVDVNARSLGNTQKVMVATLLHEIMHAIQNDHGTPGHKNFHNNEFQAWAWWLGIPTDEGGHFLGVYDDSIFDRYAKERGLEGDAPVLEEHSKIPKAPGSPLKKWTCTCGTNARVATFFDATCNLCGTKFELQEKAK